jgi:phosphate transport system permease protein
MGRYVNPWLRPWMRERSRAMTAVVGLGKFLAGCLVAVWFAWVGALVLSAFGFDPRGPLLGPYSQRNCLVVGFVMGFAIIPIIYTIAEDALSSVPEHLRAGSLATGATRWQTAVRIIIPTAMSGLFSAVMIGLGRAVGETMIVLMGTGNTPILDWSIFSGARTLSANIAVELQEAAVNSTHYRVLFLSALVLFGMTFVVNTLAEVVRQRFRRRAYQL